MGQLKGIEFEIDGSVQKSQPKAMVLRRRMV